jgi:hypothetical protein
MVGRRPIRFIAAIALAAVASVLAACGSSDVRYVSNKEGGLFLKVPDSWTVFDVANGKVAADPRTTILGPWRVVLDSAAQPSRSHLESSDLDSPVGFIEITPLANVETPPAPTQTALRSLMFGDADPLAATADSGITVVDYAEVELSSGYWGNQLLVRNASSDGSEQTILQLAYANETFSRIYVMRVFCSSECFDQHQAEIQSIVDSWTLENR